MLNYFKWQCVVERGAFLSAELGPYSPRNIAIVHNVYFGVQGNRSFDFETSQSHLLEINWIFDVRAWLRIGQILFH